MKEEKKRKQSFHSAFANVSLVESTLKRMSVLLEDYVASRDTNTNANTNTNKFIETTQQEERMSPKRTLTVNATRRKPVTPKKLKTTHPVQQSPSPVSSYSHYTSEQKVNSVSPVHEINPSIEDFTQILGTNTSSEEQLIKLMMTNSQLQERIAEYINQHISESQDQPTSLSNHSIPIHSTNSLEQTEQATTSPTHLSIGDLNVNLAIDDLLNTIRTDPAVEAKLIGIVTIPRFLFLKIVIYVRLQIQ